MDDNSNPKKFDYDFVVEKLTCDLQRSLEKHFGFNEKVANWKANLAIEMAEANSFIDELIEDAVKKARIKHAKLAHLEAAFHKAFADVFDATSDEVRESVEEVMGHIVAHCDVDSLFDKSMVSPSNHGDADELEEPPPILPS